MRGNMEKISYEDNEINKALFSASKSGILELIKIIIFEFYPCPTI